MTSADGYPLPLRSGGPRVWEDDGLWSDAGEWAASPCGNLQQRIELFAWSSPGGTLRIPVTLIYNSADASLQRGIGFGFHSPAARLSVDADDQSVTIDEPDGTPRRFVPDGAGGYRAETLDFDRLARLDSAGLSFALELTGGTRRTFGAVSEAGFLVETSRSTRTGDTVTFSYTPDGTLAAIADSVSRQATFRYDAGLLVEIDDPEGRAFNLAYDAGQQLIAVAAPAVGDAATRVELSYDDQHRIAARTSWSRDRSTAFAYDANGRLISIDTPDQNHHRIDYHPGQVVISDSLARSSVLRYANGAVFESVAPSGLTREIARDGKLRAVQVTDGFGHVRSSVYDDADNIVTFTDDLGRSSHMTWDAHHNLLTTTNSLGQTQQQTYDAFDQVLCATNEIGEKMHFGRDAQGNLTSVVDFAGVMRLAATYDSAGRLLTTTDEAGLVTTIAYDDKGNPIQVTAPGTLTTSRTVTAVGRTLTETNWLGETTTFQYDALGRQTQTTLPNGGTVALQIDALGRPLSMSDQSGPVAQSQSLSWTAQDLIREQDTNGIVVQQTAPTRAVLPPPSAINCAPSCGPRCGSALPDSCGGTIDCACQNGMTCSGVGYCLGGAR